MIGKDPQNMQLIFARPVNGSWVLLFKAILAITTLFVIYESLVPSESSTVNHSLDKVVHFGAYFVLVCLAALAFPKAKLGHIVGAMIILGTALEGAQGLMNWGRSASIGDLIANSLGACLPALSWISCVKHFSSRFK